MESKEIFYMPHLKDCFRIEFAAYKDELMPRGTLTSFRPTLCNAHRYFAGH